MRTGSLSEKGSFASGALMPPSLYEGKPQTYQNTESKRSF